MPYTGSQAFIPPVGTLFNLNTGTVSSPVWTAIGEVKTIKPSGRKVSIEKTTNLQSVAEEKLGTLLDSGTVDVEYNYLGSDSSGIAALEAAFDGKAHGFQIVLPGLPSGNTETAQFNAIIEQKDIDQYERDKAMMGKVKLAVTNAWTFSVAATPGLYSISGTITGPYAVGATVFLMGAAIANTVTDSSGHFSFTGLPAGAYDVVPVAIGHTMTPAYLAETVSSANITGVNFVSS